VASLRSEQLTIKPPVTSEADIPSLSIHLGRTKNSSTSRDDVVYLTGATRGGAARLDIVSQD
jgi:hypothetical protein